MDGLGGRVEDRVVFGVENSSMFLECSPKSQRALIYWQLQKPSDDRKHEVCMCFFTDSRDLPLKCMHHVRKCIKFCCMMVKHSHINFDFSIYFRLIRVLQTKHLSARCYTTPVLCYHVITPDLFDL